MRRDQLAPRELTRDVEKAINTIPAARHCPIHVIIDGETTEATVTRVSVSALGVTVWADR